MANRDIAYRVADRIEKSGSFDMFQQFHEDGRPSCIAGHVLDEIGDTARRVQPTFGDIRTIREVLGIDMITTALLCQPMGDIADVRARPGQPNHITPAKAAAQLRRVGDGKRPHWGLPVVEGRVVEPA